MHHQNRYGSLPTWKATGAHEHIRSIYGMWSPESFVMRDGRKVVHISPSAMREEVLYRGETDAFKDYIHERGMLIVTDHELLLARMRGGRSDQRWLWRGRFDKFEPCSDGVIVEKNGKIFLATAWGRPYLLHQGPFDSWKAHPQGAVIRSEGLLSLATKEGTRVLMSEDEMDRITSDDGSESWLPHKHGVIYMKDDQLLLARSRMYHELLHDFAPSMREWVAQEGGWDGLRSSNPGQESADTHRQLRLSGCMWTAHPDGCLVQYEDKLDLVTDEGRVNLCQGRWDGWSMHPYGVMVRNGTNLTLHDGEQAPRRITSLPEDVPWGATPFSGINVAILGGARIIL